MSLLTGEVMAFPKELIKSFDLTIINSCQTQDQVPSTVQPNSYIGGGGPRPK